MRHRHRDSTKVRNDLYNPGIANLVKFKFCVVKHSGLIGHNTNFFITYQNRDKQKNLMVVQEAVLRL